MHQKIDPLTQKAGVFSIAFRKPRCDHFIKMTQMLLLFRRLEFSLLAVATLAVSLLAVPALAQSRVALATRSLESLASTPDAGPIPSSQRLAVTLTLTPDAAREALLDIFLAELGQPDSPRFHKWISPREFADRYGATQDQLAGAVAWAQGQGLSIDDVSGSGTRISVSGSASQWEAALAIELHLYQVGGALYFANASQPSLPIGVAPLFSAIDGLDNLPASSVVATMLVDSRGIAKSSAMNFPALVGMVDANAMPILSFTGTSTTDGLSASQLAEYSLLFRQAAAQGITTLVSTTAGNFPGALGWVTAVALPGDAVSKAAWMGVRPDWQMAPGLPDDALRVTPDLTASSMDQLARTLATIAGGNRLGNINETLYRLAPTPDLFRQPDSAPVGTWESATGLGLVNPERLASAYPRGSGSSTVALSVSSNVSIHGQPVSLSASITAGTAGATPTGTISFATTSGKTLANIALVTNSAVYTTNAFDGGIYNIVAVYSGDSTYASSQSAATQLSVQPEPSILSVSVGGQTAVGSTFNVVVTDSVSYGVPTGQINASITGTGSNYLGTLSPLSSTSSSATLNIPAGAPGTINLAITCTSNANYSCLTPYTTTVTISKATPTLAISYSPNPAISGGSIILNAVVSGAGVTPTPSGMVRFFDNGTLLSTSALTNGSTTATATAPNTNSHSITATYDGDSYYLSVSTTAGSSTSSPIGTSTSINSSASVITLGQSITLSSTVTPTRTGPGGVSGYVQFFDGTVLLGTASVVSSNATLSTSALSGTVSHSITAVYSGDSYYSPSTSPTITVGKTSVQVATTTALTSSATVIVVGQSITFSANIVSGSASTFSPTGTVQFLDGTTALGTVGVSSNLAAYSTALLSGTVSHIITAVYSGDANFSGSTSPALVIGKAVALLPTTATLTSSAVSISAGESITLRATLIASGAGPANPMGTFQFFDGTFVLGSAAVTGNAAFLTTSSLTSLGSHTITVGYSGDAVFAASLSTGLTVMVSSGPTSSVTLTSSVPNALAGQDVVLTALVAGSNGAGITPGGSVSFYATGVTPRLLGTVQVGAAGQGLSQAVLSTTGLPSGFLTVYAFYSGDASFASASSNLISLTIADYNLIFNPPSLTLTRGQSGQSTVTVGLVGGFIGTTSLGCTPAPNMLMTCSFSPTIVTSGGTSILTVSSTAPKIAVRGSSPLGRLPEGVAEGLTLAGLFCLFVPRKHRRRLPAILLLLLSLGLTSAIGCMAGNTPFGLPNADGTPLGSTILTLSTAGSDNTHSVRHNYSFQVNIQ